MRKIEFRGKRLDNGEWVRGDLLHTYELNSETKEVKLNGHYIISQEGDDIEDCIISRSIEVAPDSVGQFTSLYDRNKKEIYEGDILRASDVGVLEVRFVRGVFAFLWNGNLDDEFPTGSPTHEWAEVVGNIHDNPKLLKRR